MAYNLFEGYRPGLVEGEAAAHHRLRAALSDLGPWQDREGDGVAAWDETKYSDRPRPTARLPASSTRRSDPSVPLGGRRSWFFITPRVGLAWDVKGNGETVLRGGFGMYRLPRAAVDLLEPDRLLVGQRQYDTMLRQPHNLSDWNGQGGGGVNFGGAAIDINDNQRPSVTAGA